MPEARFNEAYFHDPNAYVLERKTSDFRIAVEHIFGYKPGRHIRNSGSGVSFARAHTLVNGRPEGRPGGVAFGTVYLIQARLK